MLDDLVDATNFIVYANCDVVYNGRATSTLKEDNYLIIKKDDGSFLVHGSTLSTPRNYMGAGSKTEVGHSSIKVSKKSETLLVNIHHLHSKNILYNWSSNHIIISKTEADLVSKLLSDPLQYFGFTPEKVSTEFRTKFGPVDIALFNGDLSYLVEVKRRKITINNCIQLKKYLSAVADQFIGILAGPAISPSAIEYCLGHNIMYVQVLFD